MVSDNVCTLLLCSTLLQCINVYHKGEIHIAQLCIVNKLNHLEKM